MIKLLTQTLLRLRSTESIYQTLKKVFNHFSEYLKFRQKHSATRRIFNSLLGVWKCGQTLSFALDILPQAQNSTVNYTLL